MVSRQKCDLNTILFFIMRLILMRILAVRNDNLINQVVIIFIKIVYCQSSQRKYVV